MSDRNTQNERERAIDELIADAQRRETPLPESVEPSGKKKSGIFRRYKIKDVVFLAIITAMTLITGSVMPLLIHIPVFGIIQLGLGLQFSLFPVIGMMKVRKPGALVLMSLFSGVLLVFMFPPMFFCLLICAVLAEALTLAVFRGYDRDAACVLAGTVYMPLTLPFLAVYYRFLYDWSDGANEAVSQLVGARPLTAIPISLTVIALCLCGALLGRLITNELKKAGRLKQ